MIDAINYYPLSESALDYIEQKKRKTILYLQSVIEGRSSLKSIADNIIIDSLPATSFFDEKATMENYLKIKIPINITIGEWKSYIKIIQNDYSRSGKQNM